MIVILPNGVLGGTLNPMHGHMGAGRGLGQLLKIPEALGSHAWGRRGYFSFC